MSHEHGEQEPPISEAPPLERCLLFLGDGRIRVNRNGRDRFQDRFQRAGFDIDKIRTLDEFEAALRGSWHIVVEDMKKSLGESLQDQTVRATLDRDFDRADALYERRLRIRQSGLMSVKRQR